MSNNSINDEVTVVRHWFSAHTRCGCGYTKRHVLVAAATYDALEHATKTGHMPTWPLMVHAS